MVSRPAVREQETIRKFIKFCRHFVVNIRLAACQRDTKTICDGVILIGRRYFILC